MVTDALPDPPASLSGAPRAFYDELRAMLAEVRPSQLDLAAAAVKFDRGVEVGLKHVSRDDWSVWATIGDRDAMVGTSWAHEHFSSPRLGVVEDRPWTTQMVDFIAEVLRGQVEVETTFRGNTPVAVRHFNLDEHGGRQLLVETGFLVPGRLALWRPKRTTTERVSFL
jgi:hypothetical protein